MNNTIKQQQQSNGVTEENPKKTNQEMSCFWDRKRRTKSKKSKNIKELNIIKKKKNSFTCGVTLVGIVDKFILKEEPLGLLRAYREELINLNYINQNEIALAKRVINMSTRNIKDIYYTFNTDSISLAVPNTLNPVVKPSTQSKVIKTINAVKPENKEMKSFIKAAYQDIHATFQNVFIITEDVKNIDILRYKCETNYYTNKESWYEDIVFLFSYVSNRLQVGLVPKTNIDFIEIYYKYLSVVYEKLIKFLDVVDIVRLYENDIKWMLEWNKLPKSSYETSSWPIKKEYEVIDDYYHVKPEVTITKTYTSISPNCSGNCCKEFTQLGPLNLETSFWDSKCCDRKKNIECNPTICKCDTETCKNLALFNKEYKQWNHDVEERYTWGIDLYTYRNILYLFPENFKGDNEDIKSFIEKTWMITLSKWGKNGDKISKACEYIIENTSGYSCSDIEFAGFWLSIYQHSAICKERINNSYSKGIGIFCIQPNGIKQNELIAPYLGEIYPPYLWFEKQDIIKRRKLDKNLPDFYNIMWERMKSDNDGYDLLMVDPNSKGNFSSRMSHSCNPNCNTVLIVSNNTYTIGMFAMKDISWNEELTFDYNSVTEKEKEFQDAVCLCSSYSCRGHYLILSNSMIYTEIVTKFHSFLHRNAILLRACIWGDKGLTEKESEILNKYSIKSSWWDSAPVWLKRWTAFTLAFIDVEKELWPIIWYKAEKQEIDEAESKRNKEKNHNRERGDNKDSKKKKEEKRMKKEKEKERREKELWQQRRIKRSRIKKASDNNYNFINDFIWTRKKYVSSTRNKEPAVGNFTIPIEKDKELELGNGNGNFNGKGNDTEHGDGSIPLQEKQENNDTTILEHINSTKEKDVTQEDGVVDIQEHSHNKEDIPNLKESSTIPRREFGEIKMEIDDKDWLFDKIASEDLPEVSLESNDFSFLSDLNLQLESGYDKTLFENIKFKVSGITDQRIQNLAITLDKVKHVLTLHKSQEPPIRLLTDEEQYCFYWKKLRSTISERFISVVKANKEALEQNPQLCQNYNLIIQKLNYNPIPFISRNTSFKPIIIQIKRVLLEIAYIIKYCSALDQSSKYINYEGWSDMLILYAKTNIHFTQNQNVNGQVLSDVIKIRKRDIDSTCTPEEYIDAPWDAIIVESRKEYENNYIWGQLVGWFKQTVDKPNASLSTERRGTLIYPELDSFFLQDHPNQTYPCNNRNNFYSRVKENPSWTWPLGNDWSYKNKFKTYGSVQFDAVYSENYYWDKVQNYVSNIVNSILS